MAGGGGGLGATTGFGGSGVALCVVHVGGTLVKRNKRHGTNRDFIDRLVQTELIAWDLVQQVFCGFSRQFDLPHDVVGVACMCSGGRLSSTCRIEVQQLT